MPETLSINEYEATPAYLSMQSREINRLLCAAVVSKKFRKTLLDDPGLAVQTGYAGETFNFKPAELTYILSVQAQSLEEFAGQLTDLRVRQKSQREFVPAEFIWQPTFATV